MARKNKTKGWLISFEGGEGAGKSVQIKRLRDRLVKRGLDVVVLREPGGTAISEQIREVVLSSDNVGMAFTTEVFLYQASRAQLYREIVLPSLAAGKVVVMDRTRDSSSVYQGMVRGFGLELIEQLNDISTEKTKPDLTFLLDVPVGVGLGRKKEQEEINRLEMEKKDFHRKVRKAYLELAKKDKKRWWVIDGTLSIDEVEKRIWRRMKKELDRS